MIQQLMQHLSPFTSCVALLCMHFL